MSNRLNAPYSRRVTARDIIALGASFAVLCAGLLATSIAIGAAS